MGRITVAITGAAGNLGSLLSYYLKNKDVSLRLLIQRKDIDEELKSEENIQTCRIDLKNKNTLLPEQKVRLPGILLK